MTCPRSFVIRHVASDDFTLLSAHTAERFNIIPATRTVTFIVLLIKRQPESRRLLRARDSSVSMGVN